MFRQLLIDNRRNMQISPEWRIAIDDYLASERAANAPRQTIDTRRTHLQHLARRLGPDPWAITADQLVDWAGAQTWAAQTRRTRRITFRSFWAWGVLRGRTSENIAAALPRVRQEHKKLPSIPEPLYQAALAKADPRAGLILRLAHDAGLRRAEIAEVHVDDVFEDLDGWSLLVHGKGNKQRVVPLSRRLALELRAYSAQLEVAGYVFPGDDEGHLSPRWVGKLGTLALPGQWTLHALRRSFGRRTYAVERDLLAVQELLGHASSVTTQSYIEVPRDNLRRAVEGADRANDWPARRTATLGA